MKSKTRAGFTRAHRELSALDTQAKALRATLTELEAGTATTDASDLREASVDAAVADYRAHILSAVGREFDAPADGSTEVLYRHIRIALGAVVGVRSLIDANDLLDANEMEQRFDHIGYTLDDAIHRLTLSNISVSHLQRALNDEPAADGGAQ